MTWESQAKALATGQKKKIPCCSTAPSAYISNTRDGLGFFCFRCETKHFKPHGRRSAQEILEARNAEAEIKSLREIPKRCIPLYHEDVPREAVLWVLTSGLTPEEATSKYGMMYDPKTRRVCIQITGGFLARAVFGERPKYIKAGLDTTTYPLYRPGDSLVVVCEDIMSAIKVYKAGYSSVSILGTAVTPLIASELSAFNKIICWTDGDPAGDKAWVKLRRRMALYPVKLFRVRTDKDPKEIHAETIRQTIGEYHEQRRI